MKSGDFDLQLFERRLNVLKFQKDSLVRDPLVVKQHSDTPDNRREADILGASQIVQDNLGFNLGGHSEVRNPMTDIWFL